MAITITDIAKKANVSIATVSRYINHSGYVGTDSAFKIKSAIAKLGYKRKHNTLLPNKAKLIEVNFPNIDNPFYAELFEYLTSYLKLKGYDCVLYLDHFHPQNFNYYLERFTNHEICGLITGSLITIPKNVLKHNLPMVSFDHQILAQIPTVRSNNLDAGIQIAQAVISHGQKDILIIASANQHDYPINERIKGMQQVFSLYHIQPKISSLNNSDSIISKKITIQELLAHHNYGAICCTDDITALLAKQCTTELNLHPLITGFDGTNLIQALYPSLITARQHTKDIAELMSDLLIKRMHQPLKQLESIYTIPVSLINQI